MTNTARNPTTSGFTLDAGEFLKAAELLLNRSTVLSLPVFFLFSRAIELSLKSYLLRVGVSGQALGSRELGHNLVALLRAANERGLADHVQLDQLELGALDLLSHEYMSTRLGYRDTGGTYYLPRIDLTETAARKLFHKINSLN